MDKFLRHSFSLFGTRTRKKEKALNKTQKTRWSSRLFSLYQNKYHSSRSTVHLALSPPATLAGCTLSNTPRQLGPWHLSCLSPHSPWPSPTAHHPPLLCEVPRGRLLLLLYPLPLSLPGYPRGSRYPHWFLTQV